MRRTFKSSTALVASLSLILPSVPLTAFAEDTPVLMICPGGAALPCAEGIEPIPAPKPAVPAAEAPAAGEAAPAAEAPAAEAPAAVEAAPAAESVPADAPAAEAQPAEEPVAQEPVAEEPAVESQPAVTPDAVEPSAEDTVVEPQVAVEPVAEPQPAPEVAPEAAPVTDTDVAPAVVPLEAAPAQTEGAAPAEEGTAGVVPTAEELEKALADQNAASAPTPTEAVPAAEPIAEEVPAAEAPAADAAAAAVEVAPVAPSADDPAIALAADGTVLSPEAAAVPPLPVQPDAASGEVPIAAAAAVIAPAAADGTPAPATAPAPAAAVAQVTEETVTAASARSSSEDFANKVNQAAIPAVPAASAAAAPPVVVERRKGLTDIEKLLLLGAGALVVGAIISNNRKVEMNSGDRVVVSRDGNYQIIKDDDALLRQPGSRIRTETFNDGSTRTTVTREDGTKIVTIRDVEMRVLRRVHVARDGRETLLIDDTVAYAPVDVRRLPKPVRQPVLSADASEAELRLALAQQAAIDRSFSLAQIRNIAEVRALVPVIDLDAITFASGSAAIRPDQARALAGLGGLIQSYVKENPREVFLIEGHTDAVGSAAYNLALSDRRAESVALALTEYFQVPPENLVVQGYGEEFLKINTAADERANRRASVRRITDLLQ